MQKKKNQHVVKCMGNSFGSQQLYKADADTDVYLLQDKLLDIINQQVDWWPGVPKSQKRLVNDSST